MKKVYFCLFVLLAVFFINFLKYDSFTAHGGNLDKFSMFLGKCYMPMADTHFNRNQKSEHNVPDLRIYFIFDHKRGQSCFEKNVHSPNSLYGITMNAKTSVVWATNFKWITEAWDFYDFFQGSRITPFAYAEKYELDVFEKVIVKLFDGSCDGTKESKDEILKTLNEIKKGVSHDH